MRSNAALGWFQPVVTVCDFFSLSRCYASPTVRIGFIGLSMQQVDCPFKTEIRNPKLAQLHVH